MPIAGQGGAHLLQLRSCCTTSGQAKARGTHPTTMLLRTKRHKHSNHCSTCTHRRTCPGVIQGRTGERGGYGHLLHSSRSGPMASPVVSMMMTAAAPTLQQFRTLVSRVTRPRSAMHTLPARKPSAEVAAINCQAKSSTHALGIHRVRCEKGNTEQLRCRCPGVEEFEATW